MPGVLVIAATAVGVILLACAGVLVSLLRYQPPQSAAVVELAQAPSGWRYRLHRIIRGQGAGRSMATAAPSLSARHVPTKPSAAPETLPAHPTVSTGSSPFARNLLDTKGKIAFTDDHADAIISWHTTVASRDHSAEILLAPSEPIGEAYQHVPISLERRHPVLAWSGAQD